MDRATGALIAAFGEDEERSRREKEQAAIAAVMVDRNGCVLEENAIAVSSFAWALPHALKLELGGLGAWLRVERTLQDRLGEILRRKDPDGKPLPLDGATIQQAYDWLVAQFELPPHFVEPPSFALRVYHPFKSKTPPEASLLNSFFLADLGRASELVSSGSAGSGLRRYLGLETPRETQDLLADLRRIEPVVAPGLVPTSRWPAQCGHPLVLLQQAAVNQARAELGRADGIMGVNGPPGTGKTTLLRDLVASCVVDRASAMAAFDDPESAFTSSGQKVMVGSNAFLHLYRLDPSLKGHEILVASSNNKAVENVSRELPLKKEFGRAEEIKYFTSISDHLANSRDPDDEEGKEAEAIETWGLISAVLGNSKNRAAFQQKFWWDEERGLRIYLKAAKGDSVAHKVSDEKGKIIEKTPVVVVREKPASGADAAARWQKARSRFQTLKQAIESDLERLEGLRAACLRLPEERNKLASLREQHTTVENQLAHAKHLLDKRISEHAKLSEEGWQRESDRANHNLLRPGFFARLFGTASWKEWAKIARDLAEQTRQAQERVAVAHAARADACTTHDTLAAECAASAQQLSDLTGLISRIKHMIDEVRTEIGSGIIDEDFFSRSHREMHLTAPWLPAALHRKREELFIAALEVQKAFIDASARKVMHNISALMGAMTAGAFPDEEKKALLGDLWSTLFMVIPVVSTTFASVDRMFGDLKPGSLGWLLVDEAGQAVPQAAVGAIMRAKRTIVVGDPLQVPPVVSLPDRLTSEICAFFKVDVAEWAAPTASTQTLADKASRTKASFRSDLGRRVVGMPLLVHRRCQDPMFTISNEIAYAGEMVPAPKRKEPSPVGELLGPSCWFDIDGKAETKWCPDEGELVVRMLRQLANAGVEGPDLFVITPFKVIEQEMRRRLEREQGILSAFRAKPEEWVRDRVGTIHTFQGREAETVILLLGAPTVAQHGARKWAGTGPNILNVAVTRAKQNLYVVGSRGAWSGIANFNVMARLLPSMRASSVSGERA
ncbi:DEAD/DEAH box helicase [Microvirga sp. 2MCAF35]|uniref:DEAD/DEAH box helicase n=1 Tax=Microvirga sp. 2MCAF35 TaxID=3232987 RepID=UPI003F9C2AF5